MSFKKRLVSCLVAAATAAALTGYASAHKDDYAPGYFVDNPDKAILNFRVAKCAQTSILSYSNVYKHISAWNGLSSNVSLSIDVTQSPIIFEGGTMPVIGDSKMGGVLGITFYFSSLTDFENYIKNESDEYLCSISAPCKLVMIKLNTASSAKGVTLTGPIMKKTFLHEVGHTLKLKHPEIDSSLEGHTYDIGSLCCHESRFSNTLFLGCDNCSRT